MNSSAPVKITDLHLICFCYVHVINIGSMFTFAIGIFYTLFKSEVIDTRTIINEKSYNSTLYFVNG